MDENNWKFSSKEGITLTYSTAYPDDIVGMVREAEGIETTPLNYAKATILTDNLSGVVFEMNHYYVKLDSDSVMSFDLVKSDDSEAGWKYNLDGEEFTPKPLVEKNVDSQIKEKSVEKKYKINDLHPEIVSLVGIFKGIGDLLLYMEQSDFSSKWGSRIFSLIHSFYDKYSSLPTIDEMNAIVAASIDGLEQKDRKELTDITLLITTVSKWDIRDQIIRDIAGKYLRDVRINQALLKVAENPDDLPAAIDSLTSAAKFELSAQAMAQFSDLSRLDDAQDIIRKIPLGWESFDEMTQGGILRPSLMLVVGKPYSGKTQVLLNMGSNLMMNGYRVLYFSMELSEKLLMMRADAAKLNMHYQELYIDENIKKTKEKLKQSTENMTGEMTVIKYPPGVSVDKIRVHCDIFETVYGSYDAVMIDYVGLLQPSKSKDNMFLDGKNLAESLVKIAEDHDCAVIAAAQATRGATSVDVKNLTEEHIGGSYGFQQVAYDTIMLSKPQEGLMDNKVHAKWVKNRSGGKLGITSLYQIPNTFKLTDNVNEMFSLSEKMGIKLLPEEMNDILESLNDDK